MFAKSHPDRPLRSPDSGAARAEMLFISYSHADRSLAEAIAGGLSARGHDVWFDRRAIGLAESVPSGMSAGIERCERLLVVWSQHSQGSQHVRNEYESFYMRHPEPGRLLFLCRDATPVPALYAARSYLPASRLEDDLERLATWLDGSAVPAIHEAEFRPPQPAALTELAFGPMVPLHRLPPELVEAYAARVRRDSEAQMVLAKANRMRADAEAEEVEGILIQLSVLPNIESAGPLQFWQRAFSEAFKLGPRMVAALLWAQPDDFFPPGARSERAALLEFLRNFKG